MKGFRRTFTVVILLCAVVALSHGQKKKGSEDDDDNELSVKKQSSGSSSSSSFRGTCSCRDMESQMEHLELRLDRMIELWNDFVDKNKDPYQQPQRRPPPGGMGGGRGPYFERERPERPGPGIPPERPMPGRGGSGSGRYMGRGGSRRSMEDDRDGYEGGAGGAAAGDPRRFRF